MEILLDVGGKMTAIFYHWSYTSGFHGQMVNTKSVRFTIQKMIEDFENRQMYNLVLEFTNYEITRDDTEESEIEVQKEEEEKSDKNTDLTEQENTNDTVIVKIR